MYIYIYTYLPTMIRTPCGLETGDHPKIEEFWPQLGACFRNPIVSYSDWEMVYVPLVASWCTQVMKEVGHFLPWVGRLVSHRNSTGTIVDTRNRFPQLAGRTALSIYLVFVFGTVWRSLMMLFWFKMVLEKLFTTKFSKVLWFDNFPERDFWVLNLCRYPKRCTIIGWMNVWETSNFPSIKRGIAIWDDVRWCHV